MVCHTIPIRPGRNLAIIVESAAVNYRQKKMGYNAAQELYQPGTGQFGKGPGKLVVSEECILNLEHMLKEVLVSEGAVCRFMEPMTQTTTTLPASEGPG